MQYGSIILAAGKGTRMRSNLPKVLHHIGGKPMVSRVLSITDEISHTPPIIIYGHGAEDLQSALAEHSHIQWVKQTEQLGTGHAVQQALPYLDDQTLYFILVGDAPLLRKESLLSLADAAEESGIAVLTVSLDNPKGYGRIIRDNQYVQYIVEDKDASKEERAVTEINSGVFAINGKLLKELLPKLDNNNTQNEFYLTDIVTLANKSGYGVLAHHIDDASEVLGCNNKAQRAQLERIYQLRKAHELMELGLTLADPNRIDIRGQLTIGSDCFIDVNCIFEGTVTIGDRVSIGPHCIISNTTIGDDTSIKSHTVVDQSVIGESVNIGPFAHIRPHSQLLDDTKIGNFVETKKITLGKGSKVNHLSYIGDAVIGEKVNVGAGTITCNYDGANKHQTTIEDDAFIGSNSALVAPVVIGKNSTVAAGSTITKRVEDNNLALTRSKQASVKNWQRPTKK